MTRRTPSWLRLGRTRVTFAKLSMPHEKRSNMMSAGAFCSRATRLLDVGLDFCCERSVAIDAGSAWQRLGIGPRGSLT